MSLSPLFDVLHSCCYTICCRRVGFPFQLLTLQSLYFTNGCACDLLDTLTGQPCRRLKERDPSKVVLLFSPACARGAKDKQFFSVVQLELLLFVLRSEFSRYSSGPPSFGQLVSSYLRPLVTHVVSTHTLATYLTALPYEQQATRHFPPCLT